MEHLKPRWVNDLLLLAKAKVDRAEVAVKRQKEILALAEEKADNPTLSNSQRQEARMNASDREDDVNRAASYYRISMREYGQLERSIQNDIPLPDPALNDLILRLMPIYGLSHDSIEQLIFSLSSNYPILNSFIYKKIFDELPFIPSTVNINRSIGEGGTGSIYGNTKDKSVIYKSMAVTTRIPRGEAGLKDYLLETFIQSVLTVDPDTSKYIGKLYGVYRSGEVGSGETALIIKMENLEPLFREEPTDELLMGVIKDVINILKILREKYEFEHGDLWLPNVMRGSDKKVKLIDFGFSKIKLYNTVYASKFVTYHGRTNVLYLLERSVESIKNSGLQKLLSKYLQQSSLSDKNIETILNYQNAPPCVNGKCALMGGKSRKRKNKRGTRKSRR